LIPSSTSRGAAPSDAGYRRMGDVVDLALFD
jgi:hypothetical protein